MTTTAKSNDNKNNRKKTTAPKTPIIKKITKTNNIK